MPSLSSLSRYLHLNPIRVVSMEDKNLEDKRRYLQSFKWSSYQSYIGLQKCPNWLDLARVLQNWCSTRSERMKSYANYVEEGLFKGIENPFDEVQGRSILGSEPFMDRIKRKYLLSRSIIQKKEQPSLAQFKSSFSMKERCHIIATLYQTDCQKLLKKRSNHKEARQLLIYCVCKYCSYGHSLADIAKPFSISVSGLAYGRDSISKRIQSDRVLAKRLHQLKKKLNQFNCKLEV